MKRALAAFAILTAFFAAVYAVVAAVERLNDSVRDQFRQHDHDLRSVCERISIAVSRIAYPQS